MKLNEKICTYRKRAGLSQEELAEKLGVSRQAVSKWEVGEATPGVDKLVLLARTFGITTDELLSEADVGEETFAAPGAGTADRAMGFLGRLVRKYGWLAGVYIAVVGLVTAGTCLICLKAFFPFPITHIGTALNYQPALRGPVYLVIAIGVIGLVILMAGIILAVKLYRKREI